MARNKVNEFAQEKQKRLAEEESKKLAASKKAIADQQRDNSPPISPRAQIPVQKSNHSEETKGKTKDYALSKQNA
jgi:hypothetical protein